MINSIKGTPVLAVLMLIMGITQALPVEAAKLPTGVELDVYEDDDDDDLVYRYDIALDTKKKCRKARTVIVYHDENANGKKDKGEYVIRRLKFKRKHEGFRSFKTPIVPPEGDKIGVLIKSNDICLKGFADIVFTS